MLDITIDLSLNWNDFINSKLQQCYSTLTCVRKIKSYTSYNTRKQLAESSSAPLKYTTDECRKYSSVVQKYAT